jgi:two-component system, OmpR family, phosphate regulon response regulator PhoB
MPLTITPEATRFQQEVKLGRVLVVEDEELIRETIALALTEEGYEVLVAEDGRRGLLKRAKAKAKI